MTNLLNLTEIKKKLTPFFERDGLLLVIIFGSVAQQRTHKKSDIDIALLFKSSLTDDDLLKINNKIIQLLNVNEINIVDIAKASPLLAYEIVRNGKPVFKKYNAIYPKFVSLSMRKYIDAYKIREAQKKYIDKFIADKVSK